MSWLDDALTPLAEAEAEANTRITDEQRLIQPGDYVILRTDDTSVVGKLFTEKELLAAEKAAGATTQDLRDTKAMFRNAQSRGYLHGTWYSPVEPDGEMADTHVSQLGPVITEETFNALRAEFNHSARMAALTWQADVIRTLDRLTTKIAAVYERATEIETAPSAEEAARIRELAAEFEDHLGQLTGLAAGD